MNTFTEFKLSGLSDMRFYHPDDKIEKDMTKKSRIINSIFLVELLIRFF